MEERLVYQDMPGSFPNMTGRGCQHPLYLTGSDKVVSISHHLAPPTARLPCRPLKMAL